MSHFDRLVAEYFDAHRHDVPLRLNALEVLLENGLNLLGGIAMRCVQSRTVRAKAVTSPDPLLLVFNDITLDVWGVDLHHTQNGKSFAHGRSPEMVCCLVARLTMLRSIRQLDVNGLDLGQFQFTVLMIAF